MWEQSQQPFTPQVAAPIPGGVTISNITSLIHSVPQAARRTEPPPPPREEDAGDGEALLAAAAAAASAALHTAALARWIRQHPVAGSEAASIGEVAEAAAGRSRRPASLVVDGELARFTATRTTACRCEHPTAWTVIQHDGLDHPGLWYNAHP